MILRSRELRAGAGEWTRHSETLVTADRLDPLRRDRNDGNSAYWPPRGTSARSRACARRNYARRLSRDGDNSRSRLRSLIETRPSLSLSLSLSLFLLCSGIWSALRPRRRLVRARLAPLAFRGCRASKGIATRASAPPLTLPPAVLLPRIRHRCEGWITYSPIVRPCLNASRFRFPAASSISKALR